MERPIAEYFDFQMVETEAFDNRPRTQSAPMRPISDDKDLDFDSEIREDERRVAAASSSEASRFRGQKTGFGPPRGLIGAGNKERHNAAVSA